MATKKQERRWFKVADSVARERWSNDEAALFLRLLAHLNTRRIRDDLAPEEAVQVLLGPAELAHLAGCQSLVRARRTLGGLAVHLGLTWSARGADTLVAWPKVAEIQGWRCPSQTREMPLPYPTPSPTPNPREESEKNPEKRGSAEGERTDPPKRAVARSPAPPAAWAMEAAEALRASVRRRWPGAPVPEALIAWARELERIRAEPDAVQAALRWYVDPARDGDRYVPECRSGRTFREKFDRLVAAKQRAAMPADSCARGPGPQRPVPGGLAYRAFTPKPRAGVAVVSVLSDLRKAMVPGRAEEVS